MLSNVECEINLIATAIVAPSLWGEINHVSHEDFTDLMCQELWFGIKNIIESGRKLNLITLIPEIYADENSQKKARVVIGEWVSNLISSSNGPEYARIVKDLSHRRKIVQITEKTKNDALNGTTDLTPSEIASNAISELSMDSMEGMEFLSAHELGNEIYNNLSTLCPCYSTGLPRLDKALAGGFYKGRFYGLGARMKSGKSLLMSTIAYNMTINGSARVLYLCLEMGAIESFQRVLSMHMGINALQFLKPDVRTQPWFKKRVQEANEKFKECNCLTFRSRPRMTLTDLKATIYKAGICGKYDGIIVDYIQLVEGKEHKQSSSEHYDNVAQTLAEAVKRFPIWILSAAQLNRDGNIRGSDGLLMACDAAFNINKKEGEFYYDGTKTPDKAWLEMTVSRYTPYADIGSEEVPAYEIDPNSGPKFIELRP